MGVVLLIIVLVAIAAIWCIATKNGFTKKELKVTESMSGIEVALTKRYDMLTKMMNVAKGYAKHEKEIFSEVVKLRSGMDIGELNDASAKMDRMMDAINVTAENYPELRSSDVFVELQEGIFDAEEHLQAARRLYNANVTAYNTAISMFPASLLAGGCTKKEVFVAEEHKKKDVVMDF